MAGKANFSLVRGDTFRKTPTFRKKTTKVPVDLTGATIIGHVESSIGDTAMTCSVVDGPAGKFKIELAAPITALLPIEVCTYEVKCRYPDDTYQTLLQGNLVVTE